MMHRVTEYLIGLYRFWYGSELYRLRREVNRLQCQGTFSLDRDPFAFEPVVHAYACGDISGGKLRECLRRWLAGENFRDPKSREWEQRGSELEPSEERRHIRPARTVTKCSVCHEERSDVGSLGDGPILILCSACARAFVWAGFDSEDAVENEAKVG